MSWWNASWDNLEPETAADIRSQPPTLKSWGTIWACGCEESTVNSENALFLHVCLWHEGFDEGVSRTRGPGV